ncbi:MAG: hypothetical protein QM638_12940 [Nocardioides sp.]|uniref:hypothetical protein n=1 Tax=Nocardioides sp. TaxID=35761 RepID=UPI0039E47DF7
MPSRLDALLAAPVHPRARLRGALLATAALAVPPVLAAPARAAGTGDTLTVRAGETLTLEESRDLGTLILEDGASIVAADGYRVTLTVNGIEVGATLLDLYDEDGIPTYIAAGRYHGTVRLAVATANDVTYSSRTWPFRQAVYVDADGIDTDRSVLAAVRGGRLRDRHANAVRLTSRAEAFNGFYVVGGDYRIVSSTIGFRGNGRSDFCGYGAAVYASGEDTSLRLVDVTVTNTGVVRPAVIADGGSTVVVRDSRLRCHDGVLPDDYENTSDTAFMMSCPWTLGMYGTVRTTNLIGQGSKATYLNSTIAVDNWGCLSVDSGKDCILVSVNSLLTSAGDGYGSYGIGDVTEHFLGTRMSIGTYFMINRGTLGTHYGDSSPAAVAALNDEYDLGLTGSDIRGVVPRACVLRSRKFGWMWHDTGDVLIDGATSIRTAWTTFLSKASPASVTLDGSDGASLHAENGVIFQVMDNDNPGTVAVSDKPWSKEYDASYVEPTDAATKSDTWDTTTAAADDAYGTFSSVKLTGDFYNSVLGGGNGSIEGQNLVLSFTDCRVRGVLSASTAKHNASTIDFDNYEELGVVTNTVSEVVNNGVIVSLAGSTTWTLTGVCHLSSLTVGSDVRLRAADGGGVTLSVDGSEVELEAGTTYTGSLTLTPQ